MADISIKCRLKTPGAARAGFATLAHLRGETVRNELRRNAGIVAEYCAKMTPPTTGKGQNKNAITQSWQVQQRAGKKAITRDIRQAFQPLRSIQLLKNEQWAAAVNKLIRKRDIKGVERFLQSKGVSNRVVEEATIELHQQRRNRRGRVRKNAQPYLVIKGSSIKKLLDYRLSHEGAAKAGWIPGMSKFGRPTPPAWVSRHNTHGSVLDQTGVNWGRKQSIRVLNKVGYASSYEPLQIPQKALEVRATTAAKEIREILRGKLKQGMRSSRLGR